MKIFISIFILLISITNVLIANHNKEYLYWENLSESEKSNFISSHNINNLVMDYYKGNLKITDDENTFEILDELVSADSELFPFYYYIFTKICSESDGAVSEILGKYCLQIIINDPNYVINHFTFERESIQKDKYSYQLFGEFLGVEMYFKAKGTSDIDYNFAEFKEYLNSHLQIISQQNKNILSLFYNCISESINKMS